MGAYILLVGVVYHNYTVDSCYSSSLKHGGHLDNIGHLVQDGLLAIPYY